MAQSLWHRKDLERIAQVLIAVAPCAEYAAGVAALCAAVGGEVKLPEWPTIVMVEPERRWDWRCGDEQGT